MGISQATSSLHDDTGRLTDAQWPMSSNQSPQVCTGDEFRYQEMDIAIVARIMGTNQMRMIQLGLSADLANEIGNCIRCRLVDR